MPLRYGDARPYRRTDHRTGLSWTVMDRPIRWLPRHGEPYCVLEWISQMLVRAVAFLPVYTAIIATLTLLLIWVTH